MTIAISSIAIAGSGAVFNVLDYGALGNGTTSDTAAIQEALDAMSAAGGGTIVLPGGKTYLLTSSLSIQGDDNWQIDLCGSTLKMADNAAVAETHCILNIQSCDHWSIRNGTLDGNVNGGVGRTPDQVPCHNFYIRGCSHFTIQDVVSKNSVVDGFYIAATTAAQDQDPAAFSKHGMLINCIGDGNSRQGCSIINAYDIEVRGGAMINTGGLSPEAGMDIERNNTISDGTPSIRSIRIYGVRFEDNTGNGLESVDDEDDVVVENCYFNGNAKAVRFAGHVRLLNNRFEGSATDVNGMVQLSAPNGNVFGRGTRIEGNEFIGPCSDEAINISGSFSAEPLQINQNFFLGYTGVLVTYEAVSFCNNRISGCGGTVLTLASGSSHSSITGNIFLDSPSTQQMISSYGSNVLISGNVFANCASTYVLRGWTGTNCLFSGNVLSRGDTAGQLARNESGCLWKFNNNLATGYAADVFYGTGEHYEYSAYTPTNVSTDRAFDANSTTTEELADVLGTLIADLKAQGILS